MLRRVALVRTDVSEEPSASFIRVTRIDELGTTQAAISKITEEGQGSQRAVVPVMMSDIDDDDDDDDDQKMKF
jgi:hypothetical protein